MSNLNLTLHLMTLDEQLEQASIWIQAARANIRAQLSKRPPLLTPEIAPAIVPVILPGQAQITTPVPILRPAVPVLPPKPTTQQIPAQEPDLSLGFSLGGLQSKDQFTPEPLVFGERRPKAVIRTEALSLGIPNELLVRPDFLNGGARPTYAGCQNTENLIAAVKEKKAAGQDPSTLWFRS